MPRQPYHVRQLRLADVQQVHPQGLGAAGPPGRAAACKVWRYSPSRCRVGGGDGTTAFGLKRTAFIKRVDQLTGGGSAKSHWTGNRSARGWAGWKMLTPEEVSAGQDGQSCCGRCEKPFEPLLAETYCSVCIAAGYKQLINTPISRIDRVVRR